MITQWFLDFFNNTLGITATNEFNIFGWEFSVGGILALLFLIFTSIVIYEIYTLIKYKCFK